MAANTFDVKINEIVSLIPESSEESATPLWAKYMVDAFRGLCTELRKLNDTLSNRIDTLSNRIDQLEVRNAGNEAKIKSLEEKLDRKTEELEQAIDDNSQYSRRNCLLIHGVPEVPNENIDVIISQTLNTQMNLGISVENLVDRAHRLGKPGGGGRVTRNNKSKVRPIIVKFTSYRTRRTVFYTKKNLKGTGILITESLTKRRYKLLLAAQEKYGHKSCWTIDGRVMANVDNKKVTITSYADLI